MMTSYIILSDDWELRGNGSGNVDDMQAKPARRLMDIYEEHDIRSTFNVEVLQQLSYLRNAHSSSKVMAEAKLWERTVNEMLDRGFDVQLHLHPQWWDASFSNEKWKLNHKWNIVDYSRNEIFEMVGHAVSYLNTTFGSKINLCAFRAGSWGAAPNSSNLKDALIANNIFVDASICAGIKYDGDCIKLDYTDLESPYLPYFANKDDFRLVELEDKNKDFFCIPTQSVPYLVKHFLGVLGYESYGGSEFENAFRDLKFNIENRIKNRFKPKSEKPVIKKSFDIENAPNDPFGFVSGSARENAILDLSGNRDIKTFKLLVDIIFKRHEASIKESFQDVLLFENHTKDLQTDQKFADIMNLIKYIKSSYPHYEFTTISEFIGKNDLGL